MTGALLTALSALAVLAGFGLIGYAVACRLGRSAERREWASGSEESARTVMLTVPGGGALLVALGCLGLTRLTEAAGPFVVLFAVVGIGPTLWAGMRLPVPLRLYPSWARGQRARVRSRQRAARGRSR